MTGDQFEAARNLDVQPVPDDNNKAIRESEWFHRGERFRRELGWLGMPFGGRAEKPGNISAFVVIAIFIFLGFAYFYPQNAGNPVAFKDMFTTLISVVTLILGYLFGTHGGRYDD